MLIVIPEVSNYTEIVRILEIGVDYSLPNSVATSPLLQVVMKARDIVD